MIHVYLINVRILLPGGDANVGERKNPILVGSVKVIFLSYRYRADKSTIFGMRGLWGHKSGRGIQI